MLGWSVLAVTVAGLLVPAGMVTAARLMDSSSLGWVMLRALTPLAVVPYLCALLLLALACVRGQGAGRAVAASVGLVVAVALVLHVSWAIGPYLGPAPAAASGSTFRVMSVNLKLGQADVGTVLRTAVRERVDVLVAEEVTGAALAELEGVGLDQRFPFVVGEPAEGRNGMMVFSVHRLRPVARIPTSTPGYAMDVDLDGRRVRLVAVHPISPNNGIARWAADQELVRQTATSADGPTLVVGDFNATMDHQPLRELVGSGFRDAATEARSGWQPTWPSAGEVEMFGLRLPPLFALDHVFLGGSLRASWTRTVTVEGTDHRALVVQVSL